MGFFIWWCLVDQRLTTWTPLVGITSVIIMSIFSSPYYLLFYITWVLIMRLTVSIVYVLLGFHLKIEHIPLMLYNQWVGPVIKLFTMYNLKKQSWGKGKNKKTIESNEKGFFLFVQNSVRYMLISINIFLLIVFCGFSTSTLSLPPLKYFIGVFKTVFAR